MTSKQLDNLNRIVQNVTEFGLKVSITVNHDSCGDGAVLVTTDNATAEVYHDLLCVGPEGEWEVVRRDGWRRATPYGIAQYHFQQAKEG